MPPRMCVARPRSPMPRVTSPCRREHRWITCGWSASGPRAEPAVPQLEYRRSPRLEDRSGRFAAYRDGVIALADVLLAAAVAFFQLIGTHFAAQHQTDRYHWDALAIVLLL